MPSNDDEKKPGWPRVTDADSLVNRIQALRRRLRALYVLVLVLIVGQVFVVFGVLGKIQSDERGRGARFCLLAQQAVNNATPETPVDPLLIAASDVAGCTLRLPAGVRVS